MAATARLFLSFIGMLLILAATLSLGACSSGDDQQARETAAEHLFRAESFLKQGQLRSALVEARNAERALPARAETMALSGRIFFELGAMDKADTLFEKLAKADKLTPERKIDFVQVLLERGRLSRALKLLESPQNASLMGLRAQALAATGNRNEARQWVRRALDSEADNLHARIAQASLAFMSGDPAAREDALAALGELDDWRAWLWRARLEQAAGQDKAAVESLSRVLVQLKRQDVMTAWRLEAMRRMMNSLIRLDRPDEAMQYSQQLASHPAGELASRYDTALAEAREGNLDRARTLFKDILEQSPHHGGSAMALGLMAYSQQSWDDARHYLSTAGDAGNDSAIAVSHLATVMLQNGEHEAALERVEASLEDYPGNTELLALKGLALQRAGRLDEATGVFTRVLEQDPGNTGAALSLGQIRLKAGDLDQAERFFEDALAVAPDNEPATRGLIMVADARGERQAAMARLHRKAEETQNARLWLVAAKLHMQFKEPDAARKAAQRALAIETDEPDARAMLGALDYLDARRAFSRKDYESAYKMAAKAAARIPDDLAILLLQASAATAAGEPEKALAVAQRLQARAPEAHHGFELEGDIHTQLDQAADAEQAYSQAWSRQKNPVLAGKYVSALAANGKDGTALLRQWTQEAPDSASAWLTLASTLEENGDKAEAIKAYQRVSTLLPESAPVLNNLAWLYFESDDERALATAADAYALAPDNPAIADTYGWILWHNGEPEKARQLVASAARALPDDEDVQAHWRAMETQHAAN